MNISFKNSNNNNSTCEMEFVMYLVVISTDLRKPIGKSFRYRMLRADTLLEGYPMNAKEINNENPWKVKISLVPQISLLFHSPFHMESYEIHCLWNYFHWSISLHFHWVSLGMPNENPIKINFHWVNQWNFNFSLGCSKIFIGFS